MRLTPPKVVLVLCLGLAACEPAATEREASRAAGTKSKTKNGKKACFKIVNGEETSNRPEVGFIFSVISNTETGACTGTFVSANTMLTAAHCIENGLTPNYVPGTSFDLSRGDLIEKWVAEAPKVKDVIVSELDTESNGTIRSDKGYKDIAVIIFEDDVAPAIMPLLGRSPKKDEKVEVMGFGLTTALEGGQAPSVSKKRHGFNKIYKQDQIDEGYKDSIVIVGDATTNGSDKSLTGHGDSGGPLIVDGAIAGICSSGGPVPDEAKDLFNNEEALTAFADLSSSYALDFLKDAEAAGAVFTHEGDDLSVESVSDENTTEDEQEEELCE